MHLQRNARELAGFCAFLLLIQGCEPSEDSADSVGALAGDEPFDLVLSGSVGDGPVTSAMLRVISKDNEVLVATIGDQLAAYNVQVQTMGNHYPLTIEASGGIDMVTGMPLDFALLAAATEVSSSAVVNLSPFSTLAVAIAQRMSGGFTQANVSTAIASVLREFNLGLTSQLSLNPMTTPIEDSNLAEIVKSSEALAEILRRTAQTMRMTDRDTSNQSVINAIAADLVDGAFDGRGATGANSHISATTLLVTTQVALESIRNELRVNGRVVTPVLDGIIMQLSSGAAPDLTDTRPVTSYLIDHASAGVEAAIALGGPSELNGLLGELTALTPGASAATARQSLPANSGAMLTSSIIQLGAGSAADIDLVLTGQTVLPGVPPPPPPANTPPLISGVPPLSVTQDSPYQFTPTASDVDDDTLTFSIVNRPSWASFSTATGALTGTPTGAQIGSYANVRIRVTDGQETRSLSAFTIRVLASTPPPPSNTAPTVTGVPDSSVMQDVAYEFLPGGGDADGDTLTYTILGRPTWASFSQQTGALTGTPTAAHVSTYSNIRINVTDGQAGASLLAFSITVTAAPPPPPPPPPPSSNAPPTITGVPSTSVLQETLYTFTPAASDADPGDALTFTIVNQPGWSSFDFSTGVLSGTPTAGNVGIYSDIRISVNDGQASASLPVFSITVDAVGLGTATLSWQAPTTNTDGSPLNDLAGYRIRWGGASGSYTQGTDTVMNPGITTYVVENLGSGAHFFVVTALNTGLLESSFSNEASKTIP